MTTQPRDRIDQSLIALRRILRVTELSTRDLAHSVGLTPAQLRVLQIVEEKGGSTPKALADQMGVSQATITTLVDKLVAKQLVERVPSELDRRQTNVMVTTTGLSRLKDAPDTLQQIFVRKFSELKDWEQALLVSSLERTAHMLDAKEIDAAPVLTAGELHAPQKAR
ncbi:MAG: MarR family transcriptional regulator [Sedimentitalea sp.]|uniref:MarR family winged helix-turn-helix transcriptional regulator n=1 Tax=Sedimentitalea sp. TaxID=2048915 RepID=UPI0032660447